MGTSGCRHGIKSFSPLQKLFIILALQGISLTAASQLPVYATGRSTSDQTDSLRYNYGKHKHFIKQYELASLIALSYFPELAGEHITFKTGSLRSTAMTTVSFPSILFKNGKHYIIHINENIRTTGVLLSQVPFPGQVALIAHELSHVADFKKRGGLSMLVWGTGYLFTGFHTRIEKKADACVIKKGLGRELYCWTDFVLNHADANPHYLKMKKEKYLLPEEILALIKKYPE